ncbi:MAG TPA: SurA N-terminal domain-containing protein [Dehalococcoidia bacterium]|nr:SurA N-terminal domain-containing protein [Dehalococcoidia bacterium]
MTQRRRGTRPARRSSHPVRGGRRLDAIAWIWIGAGALLVIVAVLVGFGYYREYYVPPRETVLEVGDRDFKMSYFADRMRYLIADSVARGSSAPTADAPQQTLESLEHDEIIRQLGPQYGLEATDEEIDEALRRKVALLTGRLPPEGSPTPTPAGTAEPTATPVPGVGATGTPSATATPNDELFATEEEFESALEDVKDQTHLSDEELREIIHAEVLLQKLSDQLRAELPQSMEQVQMYVIAAPNRQVADQAKQRLDAGEDFLTVAEEVSPESLPPLDPAAPSAPATSDESGAGTTPPPARQAPDWLIADQINMIFREAAFNSPIGTYTDVIPSDRGFAILYIIGREDRPLDETQQNFLLTRALEDWFNQREGEILVRRHLDNDKSEWVLDEVFG